MSRQMESFSYSESSGLGLNVYDVIIPKALNRPEMSLVEFRFKHFKTPEHSTESEGWPIALLFDWNRIEPLGRAHPEPHFKGIT
jgi:hypothetical protein